MRRLALLPLLAAFSLLAGCKGDCRLLSEQLCDCAANINEKNACLQRVANQSSFISPTDQENQDCAALRPRCDCHTITTTQGKYQCGLARLPLPMPPP